MKNQMNNQKGFTLIELIIVIVILGILAVTAAPRFIDLQSDAKASTLQGVKGALQGAAQLVYAKAAIAGKATSAIDGSGSAVADDVEINGVTIKTINGYPDAAAITSVALINTFVDLDPADFSVIADATSNQFLITLGGASTATFSEATTAGCFVSYATAAANSSPAILVNADDC
jgi:MSHA pilin protein MshA